MSLPKESTKNEQLINKNAKKFVKLLFESKVVSEMLPISYNNNGHAVVILKDKTEATGYPYKWEIIFNPEHHIVVVKAIKIIDKIKEDLSYHILDIINEKNKAILWGKLLLHENSIYMIAPLSSGKEKIKAAHILHIIKTMRGSVEEIHNELLKAFL